MKILTFELDADSRWKIEFTFGDKIIYNEYYCGIFGESVEEVNNEYYCGIFGESVEEVNNKIINLLKSIVILEHRGWNKGQVERFKNFIKEIIERFIKLTNENKIIEINEPPSRGSNCYTCNKEYEFSLKIKYYDKGKL